MRCSPNPTARPTLLLVDDDEDHLALNQTILRKTEYEVLCATSGHDALGLLSKGKHVDLILLDMNLGDMSGNKFLALLEERHPELVESVPVVFFTGMASVPQSKAAGYIQKPIDNDKLIKVIASFMKQGRAKQAQPRLVKSPPTRNHLV